MSSPLTIDCPAPASETGAYRISWTGQDGAVFHVLEDGQPIYTGPETATTVTGRAAGHYAYRVETGGETSETCAVEVSPPPLGLAFGLFAVGFVVFAGTLALIFQGHRAHREVR